MAIDREAEFKKVFGALEESSSDSFTESSVSNSMDNSNFSFFDELINTTISILSYEVAGLKISIWLFFMLIVMIATTYLWTRVNKKKLHSDSNRLDKANNYLQKVGDIGRRPLPLIMLLVLITLLFVEASGFSYVFSEFLINDASERMLQRAMILGGFVVSIVLMFLTHFSGEEIHRNSVLKALDDEMQSIDKDKILQDRDDFQRNKATLENTSFDNEATTIIIPQYNRMNQKYFNWNKNKTNRYNFITIFTTIFVLTIGIGAMFVRFSVFDMGISSSQESTSFDGRDFNVKTDFLGKSGGKANNVEQKSDAIPSYFKEQVELRDKYRKSSEVEAEKNASYITYGIMMILFFGIQVVGLISGVKYSFIGIESQKAYITIKSYKKGLS